MVSWFHGENNPPGPHYGLRMEHAAKWPRHGDETGSGSMKRPETIRIGVFVHLRSSGFRGGVEFGRCLRGRCLRPCLTSTFGACGESVRPWIDPKVLAVAGGTLKSKNLFGVFCSPSACLFRGRRGGGVLPDPSPTGTGRLDDLW